MQEAIALYLGELRAAGEPIPEPTSIARTVEASPDRNGRLLCERTAPGRIGTTIYVRLHESPRTIESDQTEPGVIVDYGPDGQVVGFELIDAQRRGPWADWMQWVEALQTRVERS